MKFKEWIPILREWATMEEYKKKVEESKFIIHKALAEYRKPYVAYSGGKDSSVVLHLILQQKSDIMVLHWDYGRHYIPRWLEEEFIQNAKKMGAINICIETSDIYEILGREAINVLGSEYIDGVVRDLKRKGYDLSFVGLRKQESTKRKLRIVNNSYIGVIPECWPVADWSWKDIWAYIFSNNIPYASIYEKYGDVIGIDKLRLVTFFDPEFDKFGNSNLDGLLMWRERNMGRDSQVPWDEDDGDI